MSDITFIFFHLGFYWLYFFIFHRPIWINRRIRDVERTFIVYFVDSTCVLIVVFLVQMFELTILLSSPIFTNLIRPFRKFILFLLKEIKKEILYVFTAIAESTIDFMIIKFDYVFFDLSKRIHLELIEPEFIIPFLKWVESKKQWIQHKVVFMRCLEELYKRFRRQ